MTSSPLQAYTSCVKGSIYYDKSRKTPQIEIKGNWRKCANGESEMRRGWGHAWYGEKIFYEIEKCWYCPHKMETDTRYFCDSNGDTIYPLDDIPEWCPLELVVPISNLKPKNDL